MSNDYSSDSLLTFLREAALAGRVTPAVARSRRAAAQALFERLTDAEAADLRELDVDALSARFHDIQGSGLRTEVVQLYAERLRGALDDYFSFVDTPDGFVPAATRPAASARGSSAPIENVDQRALETVRLRAPRQRPDVFPIPLQEGRVVYLHGLPADLTTEEAAKIARVVTALANDGETEE